jgi:hypothetical protein
MELHADLVVKHLHDLEGIKQAVIEQQHFEAADVINKSISLIKDMHIINTLALQENVSLKAHTRTHFAAAAMNALVKAGTDECGRTTAEKAFALSDAMLVEALKK